MIIDSYEFDEDLLMELKEGQTRGNIWLDGQLSPAYCQEILRRSGAVDWADSFYVSGPW